MAKDDEDELDPKEVRADLIKSLKLPRRMFFCFVPKGSLGQLIVTVAKASRDQEAEQTKRKIGGSTLIKGICQGELRNKVFTLDKKHPDTDKLSTTLKLVIKRTTGLSMDPDVKVKGEKDEV